GDGHGDLIAREQTGCLDRLADPRSVADQGHALAYGTGRTGWLGSDQDLPRAYPNRARLARQGYTWPLPAGVAKRDWPAVIAKRRMQHVHEHRLVTRGHQDDV